MCDESFVGSLEKSVGGDLWRWRSPQDGGVLVGDLRGKEEKSVGGETGPTKRQGRVEGW